ncbi:MAG: DUF3450 domain-containing protein [Deltaproteobacteria bacterium]|nr:DUF3450 domain-containing protein [Deltaproteobacteria bacterium]
MHAVLMALAIIIFLPLSVMGQEPEAVLSTLEKAITEAQKDQQNVESMAPEIKALQDEALELIRYRLWLKHQAGKYATYIADQHRVLSEIEALHKGARVIALEMEPYLDQVAERLDRTLEAGLPFLLEERGTRLRRLQEALNRHDLALGEKLRRTLEALQIEAQYGQGVETGEAAVETAEGLVQGTTLRVGRLAMYLVTPDRERGFVLDPVSRDWIPMSAEDAAKVAVALDMTARRRPAELVGLPVAREVVSEP